MEESPTRIHIKDSFLSLLNDYSMSDIRVKDICATANVHRSTFYAYFSNLDALIQDVLDDIFDQMDPSCFMYLHYSRVKYDGGIPPCLFVRSNRKYVPLFYDEDLSRYFVNQALVRFLPYANEWLDNFGMETDKAIGILSFLLHGCIFGAISSIELSDEAWDEVRETIDDAINMKMDKLRKENGRLETNQSTVKRHAMAKRKATVKRQAIDNRS